MKKTSTMTRLILASISSLCLDEDADEATAGVMLPIRLEFLALRPSPRHDCLHRTGSLKFIIL